MSRKYAIGTTHDLQRTLRRASLTIDGNIKDAIENSTSKTALVARMNAPVYNPGRWPMWAKYSHHWIPPGTLKASIVHTRAYRIGSTFYSNIRALAPFASYQENGFYHVKAHRRVRGKHYMRKAMTVVFTRMFRRELEVAVTKSLESGGRIYK